MSINIKKAGLIAIASILMAAPVLAHPGHETLTGGEDHLHTPAGLELFVLLGVVGALCYYWIRRNKK